MYGNRMYVCVLGTLEGQKRASAPPPPRVTGGCVPSCGGWELNPGPLQEQQVLLTTKPPVQSLLGGLNCLEFRIFKTEVGGKGLVRIRAVSHLESLRVGIQRPLPACPALSCPAFKHVNKKTVPRGHPHLCLFRVPNSQCPVLNPRQET